MAITVQASASATVTASRSPSVTFSSWTPAFDDVVIFFVSTTVVAATPTAPAGWVNPLGGTTDVESDSHGQACVYHVVTVAEQDAGTLTYTATNFWGTAQTGNVCGTVLRGVDHDTPIDSSATTFSSTNTVTPHVLAALVGANLSTNSLVLSAVCSDGTNTYTTPSGYTSLTSSNTNQGQALYRRTALTTAGSNVAATNVTPAAGDEYCSITLAFTEQPLAETVTDDFASGINGVNWYTSGTNGALVTASSGAISVAHDATAGYNSLNYWYRRNLLGSYLFCQIKNFGNQSLVSHSVRLYVTYDGVGGTYMEANNGVLSAWRVANSVSNQIGSNITLDTTVHGWFRVRESAGTLFWDTAPDGVTWTNRFSVATPAGFAAIFPMLQSGCYATEASGSSGLFDNVNVPGFSATIAATANKATASLTGVMQPKGAIAAAAKKPTASLTGSQAQVDTGTIAAAAKKATAVLSGVQAQAGTISASARKATAALTGVMHPKGAIAAQLSRALFAGSGVQTQTGTIAALLKKATASFAGIEHPRGSIAGTARKATASLTGAQQQSGSVSATSKKPTASLTGALQPSGTISAAAKKAAAALTGAQTQTGTISAAAKKSTAALVGAMQPSGAISSVMRPAVAALAAVMQPSGFVTVTLRPATTALSGTQTQQGALAVTLDNASAALAGVMQPQGAIAAALKAALFTGSAMQVSPGTAMAIMKKLDASLSGNEAPTGEIAAAARAAVFAGSGEHGQSGVIAVVMQAATSLAAGESIGGPLAAVLQSMVFAGSGTYVAQASTGTLFVQSQRLIAALTAVMAPKGGVTATLSPPIFTGSGIGHVELGLAAALHKLIFTSQRSPMDSELRTTVIAGENRRTVIVAEDRTTRIPAENRMAIIQK